MTCSRSARCCCPNWRRWSTPSRARSTRSTPGTTAGPCCGSSPATRSARTSPTAFRSARAWWASAPSKSSASSSTTCRAATPASIPASARRSAASIVVLPVLFEGQTKAVIELASLHPFSVTHVTFLEQLTQSIGVVLNTIEATMRTEGLLQQSQQLTVGAPVAAKGAAADQRGARPEGPAARRPKRRGRAQEQGGRAGPPRARGESRGTGAHLQVQVGVPGEHVARAAHAAQFDPHPRPAARRRTRPAT